ncbi:hypothetical protein [Kineosporia succinea]|uniref:DUF3291 domain-containing protein n=1 Tax=Kineosporia succinea TaxID=84632 RepID=A0ABT9P0Z9_9ACTN|nr:hypothetical protein [Kineosporia succinea]MDP9826343.1 hypothetical protein [Kineosporia succinea]
MPTVPWQQLDHEMADDAEVVVMASRFRLHRLSQVPRFFLDALRVQRQAARSEGVVGLSLRAHPLRREFLTLSAWRDQGSLNAMYRAQPHGAVMSRHRPAMASSEFVFYRLRAGELPAGWDDAYRRLAENEAAKKTGDPS